MEGGTDGVGMDKHPDKKEERDDQQGREVKDEEAQRDEEEVVVVVSRRPWDPIFNLILSRNKKNSAGGGKVGQSKTGQGALTADLSIPSNKVVDVAGDLFLERAV
eukprot:748194-Hanusia_phi.AAC.1